MVIFPLLPTLNGGGNTDYWEYFRYNFSNKGFGFIIGVEMEVFPLFPTLNGGGNTDY